MKWEYLITSEWGVDNMNKLGAEGWELITTHDLRTLIWKRPLK